MDESWLELIGTGRSPPAALDPEDFSDVFGGPPQTVLLRKFSGDRTSNSSHSFYGLMSRPQGVSPTSRLSAGFRIPDVCYKDVFIGERKSRDRSGQGSNGLSKSKSKSKSKSNSSSVLSSEEFSPLRPIVGDDAGLSSFGLKLRPINVPCRWNSTADFPSEHQKMQETPHLPCGRPSVAEGRFMENLQEHSFFKSPRSGLSRRAPSPEPFPAEPNSDRGVKTPAEEEEAIKAASLSFVTSGDRDRAMKERGALAMSDEDDELSSSYVIEITPGIRDGADKTPRVDEAIAWDKESFTRDNAKNDRKESWSRTGSWKEHILPETKEMRKTSDQAGILCGKSKSAQMIEFEALDRNMKLWTSGTEKDIRHLLSTLHQIMWLNSGWDAVPLTSLRKISQVKKAYQKARQCLQPDRLQQRGATSLQKYIAHKALTIIQDSWTKYISEGNSR